MLVIEHPERTIQRREYFDNKTQEFISVPPIQVPAIHLVLEHSLKSIAKWESKWHEPFSALEEFGGDKLLDYIRCMTVNTQRNPEVYDYITEEDIYKIIDYIQNPMSAYVMKQKKPTRRRTKSRDTAEIFYYAMIQFGIPLECENWHFNRLLALLDVCGEKGSNGGGSAKKRSEKEIMDMYRAMNDRNRKKYNSKG